jgi:hypothetical protein
LNIGTPFQLKFQKFWFKTICAASPSLSLFSLIFLSLSSPAQTKLSPSLARSFSARWHRPGKEPTEGKPSYRSSPAHSASTLALGDVRSPTSRSRTRADVCPRSLVGRRCHPGALTRALHRYKSPHPEPLSPSHHSSPPHPTLRRENAAVLSLLLQRAREREPKLSAKH